MDALKLYDEVASECAKRTTKAYRTSISLEEPFWMALNDIAKAREQSLASLVQMIDKERVGGLSSAIRMFILAELRHQLAASTTTETTQIS